MNRSVAGWANDWVDEGVGGCVDRWMHGQMHRQMHAYSGCHMQKGCTADTKNNLK